MAPRELDRLPEVSAQWLKLCDEFAATSKDYMSMARDAREGVAGAQQMADRHALRMREAHDACVYFMAHRRPPPR